MDGTVAVSTEAAAAVAATPLPSRRTGLGLTTVGAATLTAQVGLEGAMPPRLPPPDPASAAGPVPTSPLPVVVALPVARPSARLISAAAAA